MKYLTRTGFSIAAIALFSLGTTLLLAQGNSRGEASATIGSAHVSIDYGRPMLKGRDPLSMIKPGQVWRLGANTPTTIDTDQDLLFGATRVPKGKHILLAQAAVHNPDDLNELWDLEQRVRTALSRMQTVLSRAER